MQNYSFDQSEADTVLRQHSLCDNYLAYLMLHPYMKHHTSPLAHG